MEMEREVSGSTSYSQTWPLFAQRLQEGRTPSHCCRDQFNNILFVASLSDECLLTFALPRWQATHAALTCARFGLVKGGFCGSDAWN